MFWKKPELPEDKPLFTSKIEYVKEPCIERCCAQLKSLDDLGKISININIDGTEPKEKTKEYLTNATLLISNPMFAQEIKEYIGEQFIQLGLEMDKDAEMIIRGKIFGASELYSRVKNYDLQAAEGIEQVNEPKSDEEESDGRS